MQQQPTQQYFGSLTDLAIRLVGAVHDESHDTIRDALTAARALQPPRGIDPDTALAVTLAALVNPDARKSQLLAHVARLDHGLADLYPGHKPGPEHYPCNPIAVEMALRGHIPAHALNPAEQIETTGILTRRGWPTNAIAAYLSARTRDVTAWATAYRSSHPRTAAA